MAQRDSASAAVLGLEVIHGAAGERPRSPRRGRWAGAACATILLMLASAAADPPEPCPTAERPIDRDPNTGLPADHVPTVMIGGQPVPFEVTRNLVPVLENMPDPQTGLRPYDVSLFDPTRATSRIIADPSLDPVSGSTAPTYRWATFKVVKNQDGSESEVEVQPSEVVPGGIYDSVCYHPLLFRADSTLVHLAEWHIFPAHLDPLDGYAGGQQYFGFRANANPANPLSIGDFLPPAASIGASSLCLVPDAIASHPTGWRGLSRPTLEGWVDLVTGMPLVRVNDLDLPFGGATFRLNRTRAASPILADMTAPGRFPGTPSDYWWDWTGVGWMASENPVLLIDSALPDVVGDNPRTTRLVLDAHTSIPFQLIETTGQYEAPPRFRARLRHNGTYNTGTHAWTTPPTQYEISLYEGEITCTFIAVREDVPASKWCESYVASGVIDYDTTQYVPSSSHDRPLLPQHFPEDDPRRAHDPWWWRTNPGAGIPYIGLCKEIRDRHGHRVVMDYQPATRRHMDDPATPDVIECQQDGLAKGQIRSIKLIAPNPTSGLDEVKWTLLYAHRKFPGLNWVGRPQWHYDMEYDPARFDIVSQVCPEEDPARYELHGDIAIDRIYAFEGDIPDSVISGLDLTLHHTDRPGFTSIYSDADPHDPIAIYNAANPSNPLPTTWRHQVRYHYRTVTMNEWLGSVAGIQVYDAETYAWYFGMADGAVSSVPQLMLTSVYTRPDTSPSGDPAGPVATTHRGYVYEYTPASHAYWPSGPTMPWLRMILDDRALRDLVAATGDAVVRASSDRVAALIEQIRLGADVGDVRSHASVEFARGAWSYDEPHPTLAMLRQAGYATWASQSELDAHLLWEPDQVVKKLTVRDSGGAARYFHIRRFVNPMDAAGNTPQASMWFAPYAWRGYTDAQSSHSMAAVTPPDLQTPRFIVVIDEFPDRQMLDNAYFDSVTSLGRDPFQSDPIRTQLSRRIVQINASGHVLKERKWEFTPAGTVVTGSGIGEEYRYRTVRELFPGMSFDEVDCVYNPGLATLPGYGLPSECGNPDPNRGPKFVGDQLLLVEHRSLGWSVAELDDLQNQGASRHENGLVRFLEYEIFPGNTQPGAAPTPWSARLQLVAEGVQKGAADEPNIPPAAKFYTKQVFFDPQKPERGMTAEVTFLAPPQDKLSSEPGYDDQKSDPSMSITKYLGEFVDDGYGGERRVARTVIQPPRRQRPGGPWYSPIQREEYNEYGQRAWTIVGLVRDPYSPMSSPDEASSLIFTYHEYDDYGRPVVSMVDVDPQTDLGGVFAGPAESWRNVTPWGLSPNGWQRLGGGSEPGRYITVTWYDEFGVSDIFYPGPELGAVGPRYARRWVVNSPEPPLDPEEPDVVLPDDYYVDEFVFNNIMQIAGQDTPNDPSDDLYTTQSPGEHRVYRGTAPRGFPAEVHRGYFVNPGGITAEFSIVLEPNVADTDQNGVVQSILTPAVLPPFTPLATVEYTLDSDGRPRQADLIERAFDGSMAAIGSKWRNELVDVLREQEIDGTITRMTRNLIGQHMRTYIGTADAAWEGDSAHVDEVTGEYLNQDNQPVDENGDPVHNMVITERFEYGQGINDAWLPTVHRRYRSHDRAWADQFYEDPGAADDDGYATVISYDWMRRPVRTDTYDKGDPASAPRLATTLRYLDLAGRPYMEVTFGGDGTVSLPTALDPTLRLGNELPVEPGDFYSLSPRPHTIVHTIYGPDSTASEVRRYHVPPPSEPAGTPVCQAEFQYLGLGGGVVFSQSPGLPVTLNVFDGLGRLKSASTVLPGRSTVAPYAYELTRTEYTYDYFGNVLEETHLERADPDGPDLLSDAAGNAVRTRRVNWYDTERRLIASADLGTERPTLTVGPALDSGGNPTSLYERTAQAPTPTDSAGLPQTALVTFNVYDTLTGNLLETIAPDGVVTRRVYGRANRLIQEIENYGAPVAEQRTTAYDYVWGRLASITSAAGIYLDPERDPEDPANPLEQVSAVVYGADVVDESFTVVSRNNGLVGELRLPSAAAGTAHKSPAIRLRYTFDGRVAERIDARGVVFRYRYDGLDRLASIEVGSYPAASASGEDFIPGYPASMQAPGPLGQPGGVPADRIGYVEYAYDSRRGQLTSVTAKAAAAPSSAVIAHTTFAYDRYGNLVEEKQSLGGYADFLSPAITYTHEYQPTDELALEPGYNRLTSMTYPSQAGQTARTILFSYGVTDGDDDRLSRPSSIDTRIGPAGAVSTIAAFDYMGIGRRQRLALGPTIVADFGSTSELGLPALDGFGRMLDLDYTTGAGASLRSLYRAEYTYDRAGNRASARITRAATASTPEVNVWSQAHAYDALGQLIESDFGELDLSSSAPQIVGAYRRYRDQWNLDPIGNWNGHPAANPLPLTPPGRTITEVIGGVPQARTVTHMTDNRNRITKRADSTWGGGVPVVCTYDAAGNLRCDGQYFYQYDAWNRLVQVNLAVTNPLSEPPPGDDTPRPEQEPWWPGALVKHFKYDGLGRLVVTQSPYPSPTTTTGSLRTERFYYDGIRRIQEVVIDPIPTKGQALASGDPELALAAQDDPTLDPTDDQTAPLALEMVLAGGGPPIGSSTTPRLEREYVWGPGDRGVDELLVQYASNRSAWWMLTDEGGDVVAMCSGTGGPDGTALVAGQWTYDAYGAVIAESVFSGSAPVNRCGHKGLFADRLDGGIVTGSGGADSKRLAVGARLLYQNRNRSHSSSLGRFLQADPNATGLALMGHFILHGQAMDLAVDVVSLRDRFRDGSNLYAYLRSNPAAHVDPLGLWIPGFDPATLTFDPSLYPNAPNRRYNPVATGRAAEFSALMALVGRMGGAGWAAMSMGDGVVRNRNLHSLWKSQLRDVLPSALGGMIGGQLASGSESVWGIWATNGFGAAAGGAIGKMRPPGSMPWGDMAQGILIDVAQGGLSFVTGVATGYTAGVALAAGFYAGAVEYLAETAFNWWK